MILCVLLALIATLPTPTPASLPNTEAVTNIPLVVEADRLGHVRFTLSLEASPSNNVELAIGNDADGNGALSLEEADVVFGYDCGVWFRTDTETGNVTEEDAPTEGRITRTLEFKRRKNFKADWNLLRLVRRGTGAPAETIVLDRYYQGLLLYLR